MTQLNLSTNLNRVETTIMVYLNFFLLESYTGKDLGYYRIKKENKIFALITCIYGS